MIDLPFPLLLIILFAVSFVQNMAFTWVSRSRNGGDVGYHRYAAWCSNGVWFVTQMLFLNSLLPALMAGQWWKVVLVGIVYVIATTEGSCLMMARLLKTETGARKVGATAKAKLTELEKCRNVVPLIYSDEEFSPELLTKLLDSISPDAPITHLAVNVPGQVDVVKNFKDFFDPVSLTATVKAGHIGNLLSYLVVTDAHYFKEDTFLKHRVALYSIET